MSASLAAVPTTVCTRPEATSTPMWAFIPKLPLVAFLRLVHLRVAALLLVLGRGRRGDDRGVDNRSLPHQQAALLQQRADFVEQSLGQFVSLQPMPEMQHRGRVGDRVAVQRNPGKAAQRLAVVEG